MDTKWKKSKEAAGVVSHFVFVVLLVYLMIIGVTLLLQGMMVNQEAMIRQDYQMTEEFRNNITGYLELFLWADTKDTSNAQNMNTASAATLIDKYSVRYNTNILYTVAVDGKTVYTNDNALGMYSDEFVMPAGYNFLLYFDGEKVRIIKDGVEQDVYGNGIYQDNDWYIPGYINYPAEEKFKNVRICIAAIKDPFIVIRDGGRYYNNNMYYIKEQLASLKEMQSMAQFAAAAALICLLPAFVLRRDRVEGYRRIAGCTGKIFLEIKFILLSLISLAAIYFLINMLDSVWCGRLDATYYLLIIPVVILYLCFKLFCIDIKYNDRVYRRSVLAQLFTHFDTGKMKLPFGQRILRQNRRIVILQWITVMFCFICIGLLVSGYLYNEILIFAVIMLFIHIVISYVQYKQSVKNKEMAEGMDLLVDQIQNIHNGNLSGELVLSEDTGLSEAAEYLNEIGTGMETALDEQMKSERMKVELITNVSHDIKTPLTSIISYLELLKQEDLPEIAREYIMIMDNKSQKLKSMIQDVFEVSKAASGQLSVKCEKLDLCKLLRQTLADMQEQLNGADCIVKTEIQNEPVLIWADGDRLYRVFQNLLQNAVNYSLKGSRIYIHLFCKEGEAAAIIRNTSKEELPQGVDFTERFVRGDQSRTETGSGLGLSIARSFTEACGGSLKVEMIADLFVVTVSLPCMMQEDWNDMDSIE